MDVREYRTKNLALFCWWRETLSSDLQVIGGAHRSPVALTSVKLQATVGQVKMRSFVHKGLKALYVDDITKGVPPDTVDKLRKMLTFLDNMQDPEEMRSLPAWKVHTLAGDRKGTWSLSVTRNRRLTFSIDIREREIYDVNLEDYH
jgi:proteic killer suppression protein